MLSSSSTRLVVGLALTLLPVAATAGVPAVFVYRGAGCTGRDRMAPFISLLGRNANGVTEFTETSDWAHMLSSLTWSTQCWNGKYKMALAVPMLMSTGTLAAGANGDYDAQFVALGKILVANKQPNAVLRVGWEFNGNWYRWSAANDPANFVTYFRRIVAALRSVPGQNFRIAWNPTIGQQAIAPDQVWPGTDVVDYVGVDVYNQSWSAGDADPTSRWNYVLNQPYGLAWLKTFAAKMGKHIVIPEWGTGTRPDGHGAGDDPLFVSNMTAWMTKNNVTYHGYWDYDASDYNAEISNGAQPKAASAYQASVGTPK